MIFGWLSKKEKHDPAPHLVIPIKVPEGEERKVMANILVDIEKGVEIAAEDALKFIGIGEKALKLAPGAVAAVGTILGAATAAITTTEEASASGFVNIALDKNAITAIKAVWPDVQAAFKAIGVTV